MLINAAVTAATNNFTGAYTVLDEGISAADGAEASENSNTTGTYYGRYDIGTLASDWDSWNSVSFNVRYRVAGAQTNLQVDPAGTAVAMAIALG
jgi:hypothetical protein